MFPKASGMTKRYEMISKIAGVGAETVRMFMNDQRSMTVNNLIKLAEAIGLSIPEMFTEDPAEESEQHRSIGQELLQRP